MRADVNAKNKYGNTALMDAVFIGGLEVVKYLIKRGADVNAKDKYGDTELMKAASMGNLEVVK